jgi:hypothetical protein
VTGYLRPCNWTDSITNDQSPIANNQFFVSLLQPDPQQKAFVIGDWLLVIGYLKTCNWLNSVTNNK